MKLARYCVINCRYTAVMKANKIPLENFTENVGRYYRLFKLNTTNLILRAFALCFCILFFVVASLSPLINTNQQIIQVDIINRSTIECQWKYL